MPRKGFVRKNTLKQTVSHANPSSSVPPDVEQPTDSMASSENESGNVDDGPMTGDFPYSFTVVRRGQVWKIPDAYWQTDAQHIPECTCFYCDLLYSRRDPGVDSNDSDHKETNSN